jgi:hypothetical protein
MGDAAIEWLERLAGYDGVVVDPRRRPLHELVALPRRLT